MKIIGKKNLKLSKRKKEKIKRKKERFFHECKKNFCNLLQSEYVDAFSMQWRKGYSIHFI